MQSPSVLGNVTGALLLGGESTRMGRDKAHLDWDGEAWSTRAARLLASLFSEVLLVGGRPAKESPGRVVADPSGPSCALRGLVAALRSASSPRVFVIATDLPFLSPDLLLALTAWPASEIVLPSDDHGDHPLCAIYDREACLPVAEAHLASGRLALRDLVLALDSDRVTLATLGLSDLGSKELMNVNTPEELANMGMR